MMMHKTISNVLKKVWDCNKLPVRYSALFINGAKASENFVYVTPHVDYKEIIDNKEMIQKELAKRQSDYDLCKLEKLFQVFLDMRSYFIEYNRKKEELSKELVTLIKTRPESEVTLKYKLQSDLLKDNIKKLKLPLWTAEEAAMIEYLNLPNRVHIQTPDTTKEIFHSHESPPEDTLDHVQVGMQNNLIDIKKNGNYYFINDAAIFELGSKFHFSKLLKQQSFTQFSNPDFVKSLIVEGCGFDYVSPNSTFILKHHETTKLNIENRMHLVGGGSLCAFLAYHAKNVIHPKLLPLRYYALGRQYVPAKPTENTDLFNVSQASVIETFCVTKTANEQEKIFLELVDFLKTAYNSLGCHYRLCLVPATELHEWEMLRVAVEMYSTSLSSYVEVGNVSLSGDYISKRLQFSYIDNGQTKYPCIASGTVLNVPKLLGCVLETNEEFSLPEPFKVQNWKMQ